jgi:sugar lactone lactonase YvrE
MMDVIQAFPAGQRRKRLGSDRSVITTRRAGRVRVGLGWGISCLVVFILLTVIVPILSAMASRGGPLEGVWARINPFAYARVSYAFGEEGSGPGLIEDPRDLAIDVSGNLIVANSGDGRIQKFTPSGEFIFLWSISPDSYIHSLAADRFGNVFAVHQGEIWRYDSATGKATGQVENPDDRWFDVVAASPDGTLVAAGNTEDIVRFDTEGRQVFSRAESGGVIPSQAEDVEDITVDAVGNIYVLSDSSAAVLKYAPDGRLLTRFGSEGEEKGQFDIPYAIAVDGQGRIYVSDIDGISVFVSDGRYLDEFNVPGGVAFGIQFDDQGNLWVVTNQPKVIKFKVPSH